MQGAVKPLKEFTGFYDILIILAVSTAARNLSLILREVYRMGMFADKVLTRIFGTEWREFIICSTLCSHVRCRLNENQREFKKQEFDVLGLYRGGGHFVMKDEIH
jgi:hypothetical protein